MAQPTTYLAYDLGAESGRLIAGTLADGKLSIEEVHRFWNRPMEIQGTMYWDIYGLFREMVAGLRAYVDQADALPAGVGIDTWGVDFGLLAADGSLLAPPVCYRDHRNDTVMPEVLRELGAETIYNRTGIQFMQFNSIFQLAGIRRRTPKVLDAADCLMFMADLLAYFFCGRKAVEYTLGSTSQLIDPRTRSWAADLFEKLDIPPEIMPELIEPGTILGKVSRQIVDADIPMIAVAHHDTGSAVVSVPAEGSDWACISCGTWSIMGCELAEPQINDEGLACNFTNEGGAADTTRFMKNIAGLWPLQRMRAGWVEDEPNLDYAEITRRAAEAPPFVAVVNVDDADFINPPDMEMAIRDYCVRTGQRSPADRGQMARVATEGLALSYRRTLDMLEGLTGRTYDKVHIVGGGTQNELLMQFAADAMNRTVVAGPIEATAIGNLVMQAVATGALESIAAGREVVRDSFPMRTFEPENTEAWARAYERFKQLA